MSLLAHMSLGLMFHSNHVIDTWDTWAFVENHTFYAFYLVMRPGTWFPESFGVATSADGTHWNDHGVVWTGWCMRPPCPSTWAGGWWMGSGAVWRAADFADSGRYVINWCQNRNGNENISFATSTDLLLWSGNRSSMPEFDIDARFYHTSAVDSVRWDAIYSIPAAARPEFRDGYPRHGYWTATPIGCGPYGLCNHSFGFGVTHDGLHWEALPSPLMVPPMPHWTELGAVEFISYGVGSSKGGYFALLGGNPNQVAEMVVYVAASPEGPFHAARRNFIALPKPDCYFARFFRGNEDELLVTHQSFSHVGRSYQAPYKAVRVDDEGTLRLAWWPANERLKGGSVAVALDAAGFLAPPINMSRGAVLEASVALPACGESRPDHWPGFVLESDGVGVNATLVAIDGAARAIVANISSATRPAQPVVLHSWDHEIPLKPTQASVQIRLLYRLGMLELYVENFLLVIFLAPHGSGRVALRQSGVASLALASHDLRRWELSSASQ